ncbi:hypothetical protein CDL12_14233 [Handroanthus impetiginosus]|uniref:Holocarboxylase synthetase n=1 Tax=Handroanthus impetiginosus TaxID=429701 RepID=A0A2G9GQH2_9LAMI|nr:hypothetical protein CDL12_20180 [Handroanthus impetiginosus]PIN13138.1 hypothetical protein CDL12_14233 [Handroanthus impetiginosus]
MAKKRKSDATRLDEVDRGMYTTFCSAANSLSQLYTQSMHQQRISFQAGERHSLEKLYSWISRQHEDGARVMTGDIIAYIQNELDYGTEDPPPSPRLPQQQHQQPQNLMQLPHTGLPVSSNAFAIIGQGLRSGNSDQTKNSVFSNALSSPVRRSLQHYHISHGGYSANNASRSNENSTNQTRDTNPLSSNDTSMDMHADSPGHDSPY